MFRLNRVALVVLFVTAFSGCDREDSGGVRNILKERFQFQPDSSDPLGQAISAPPPREGNTVKLLINGEASFAERMELLETAQDKVYIQALIFKADKTGRTIADRLLAMKKENPTLDIRVIVDAYSNIMDEGAQLMYFELKNAGIEVEGFESFYLAWINEINFKDWLAGNKRYHEKYWIVDGRAAIVGGMNIADEYARYSDDPVFRWRDQDVFVQGPIVGDIERAFLDNYEAFKEVKNKKPDLFNTDRYWEVWRDKHPRLASTLGRSIEIGRELMKRGKETEGAADVAAKAVETTPRTGVCVRFLRQRPRVGELTIHEAYLSLTRNAKRSITLVNAYFLPTHDLLTMLAAAARRGVKVAVVTNSVETNDLTMVTKAGRKRYSELIDAGVEVYEWHGERRGEGTLHAKFGLFDEEVAMIGSYNLDPRSRNLNSEDAIILDDETLASKLSSYVRTSDLPACDRISAEQAAEWAKLPDEPPPEPRFLAFDNPAFDRKAFETKLIRLLEMNL